MAEIQPIRIDLEREDDGRILASVSDLPGVMAYGSSEEEAVRKVKSIALQVLADMIESGDEAAQLLVRRRRRYTAESNPCALTSTETLITCSPPPNATPFTGDTSE
jgi:predicted RNase H-like HicB family nuclease